MCVNNSIFIFLAHVVPTATEENFFISATMPIVYWNAWKMRTIRREHKNWFVFMEQLLPNFSWLIHFFFAYEFCVLLFALLWEQCVCLCEINASFFFLKLLVAQLAFQDLIQAPEIADRTTIWNMNEKTFWNDIHRIAALRRWWVLIHENN